MLVTAFNDRTGLYEVMPKGRAAALVRQPSAGGIIEQLHARAVAFRAPLKAAGDALAGGIGAAFALAENKTLDRLREKAAENGSDGHDITDFVRGSIMIDHWKQVEALRRLTDPARNDGVIEIAGSRLVYFMDNFATPLGNGMRRLMKKFDVANDNGEHHVCEIQARVAAMKPAEDLTHRIYKMQRDFTRLAAALSATDHKLSRRLNMMALHCRDLIKPIHDLEAMRLGYDALITAPYDSATAPDPKNPILRLLMRESEARAQLLPILRMKGPVVIP